MGETHNQIAPGVNPNVDSEVPFGIDAVPTEQYIKQQIAHGHARTRNVVALILVWAIVLSLPTYLLAILLVKNGESMDKVFERWFSLVGPLAGTAIGAYYVSSRNGA